jgi:hypothetical protein
MVSATVRRQQVAYVHERGVSIRRGCRLLAVARSTLRYRSILAERDAPVIAAMRELGAQYPRFGYRRIRVFLERRGMRMSADRAHRIWRQAGLQGFRKPLTDIRFAPRTSGLRAVDRQPRGRRREERGWVVEPRCDPLPASAAVHHLARALTLATHELGGASSSSTTRASRGALHSQLGRGSSGSACASAACRSRPRSRRSSVGAESSSRRLHALARMNNGYRQARGRQR